MSGHNKFSKIKHKKAASDAKKSKVFSKYSKLITMESKKCNGDVNSPALATVIESAKKENMPKDTIDRAVKKGTEAGAPDMVAVMFEMYGPGGSAIIIELLTDNNNRTSAEIKHLLSKAGYELATPGSAAWAFSRVGAEWNANIKMDLEDADLEKLEKLVDLLEEHDDVQDVFTNVD